MRRTATLLTLGAFVLVTPLLAADFTPPGKTLCTVTYVQPPGANFFARGTIGPVVGETTTVDFSRLVIDDLTFSQGGAVPLKESNAKLFAVNPGGTYRSYYRGIHQTSTSDYVGVLQANHAEKDSHVAVQVLRQRRQGLMQIHELRMNCVRQ